MGVIAAAARELIAAGVTGDALVTALERIEEANKPYRSKGAERTARWREARKASHVTSQPPPKESPPTPPKEITPSSSLRSEEKKILCNEFNSTFWPAYPNKKAKADALKAFLAVRRTVELGPIMAGLAAYKANKPDWQDWKLAGGWLRAERWEDEWGQQSALPDNDQPRAPPPGAPSDAELRARYGGQIQQLQQDQELGTSDVLPERGGAHRENVTGWQKPVLRDFAGRA